jgi:dipeptidyl aminopeptidase/acylaminoacyl peptidase
MRPVPALFCLAAFPFALAQGSAQQTAAAKRPLLVDDFARIKSVGDPQLSPDGEWVAYTVSSIDLDKDTNDTDVWMVSWDGTTNLRLTSTPDAESAPRWSPDNRYLAFTSSRQEGRGSQVWLLDRRGGEAQRLTEVRGGVSSYSWSPDSKRLVFLVTDAEADTAANRKPKPIVIDRYRFKSDGSGYLERRRSHIYTFDIGSQKTDTLTTGDFDDSGPVWSPDGRYIAFISKREGEDPDRSNNSDIYVMEAAPGAAPRRLTTWPGADSGPIEWSPDGRSLLYLQGAQARLSAYSQPVLALVPVTGGSPRLLFTTLDRDVSGAQFSRDGAWLYFLITDDLKRYLARGHIADERIEKLAVANRVVGSLTMAQNGRVAVTVSSPQAPAEVHAFENHDMRKLTAHNDDWLEEVQLVDAEGIAYKTKDGVEVHAMLHRPLGYQNGKQYPTLFRIHGGPNSQNGYEFDFERQLFAAHGYAVVSPNYRGSNGRGRAWKEAIYADWGNKEVVDVLAGADHVVKTGLADAQRLGIGGWSYGCITTDYAIATDTRFKAATCGAGSALQLSLYGSDQYIVQYEQEVGLPWKNPDAWLKLSWPFFKADRIKTPTLYLGGQNDFNVPIIGGEQMYQALKSLGVPTQLIIYPNERHGIRRPSFVKDRYQRYLDWYATYLKPASAAATSTRGAP